MGGRGWQTPSILDAFTFPLGALGAHGDAMATRREAESDEDVSMFICRARMYATMYLHDVLSNKMPFIKKNQKSLLEKDMKISLKLTCHVTCN